MDTAEQRYISRRVCDVPMAQVARANDDETTCSGAGTIASDRPEVPDWKKKLVHSKAAMFLRKPAPKITAAPKRATFSVDGNNDAETMDERRERDLATTSKLGLWSAKRQRSSPT